MQAKRSLAALSAAIPASAKIMARAAAPTLDAAAPAAAAHNLTPAMPGGLLSEGGDEDRLDGVEAVLGLVEHDAGA